MSASSQASASGHPGTHLPGSVWQIWKVNVSCCVLHRMYNSIGCVVWPCQPSIPCSFIVSFSNKFPQCIMSIWHLIFGLAQVGQLQVALDLILRHFRLSNEFPWLACEHSCVPTCWAQINWWLLQSSIPDKGLDTAVGRLCLHRIK